MGLRFKMKLYFKMKIYFIGRMGFYMEMTTTALRNIYRRKMTPH